MKKYIKSQIVVASLTCLLAVLGTAQAEKKEVPKVDADGNGSVSVEEFTAFKVTKAEAMAKKKALSEEDATKAVEKAKKGAQKAFKAADADGDGKLDATEQAVALAPKKKKVEEAAGE